MHKYKVWLSILLGLGVLIPVLSFSPVEAIQDNPDRIHSKKTQRPTLDNRYTATLVPTRESIFHSTPSLDPSVPASTEVPTLVDTLDPYEVKMQQTFDAIETMDTWIQAEKKKNPNMDAFASAGKKSNPNTFCGKSYMVIPVGMVMLALFKRRNKNMYL